MLARRYSGNFRGLPRVRYFEAWNEPNLSSYLTPQWVGKRVSSSGLYRKMLNNFYAGVKRVQPHSKVIGGATAPFGDDVGHPLIPGSPRTRPLVFLRKLFCLKGSLKPSKCPTKPHLNVLSHHPVNVIASPENSAASPDDVLVADFHKLGKLLHAAERTGHVSPKKHHQLWATEIWWITKPPNNRIGVPVEKHARWLEQSLYLLWKQGARVVVNYRDPRYGLQPSPPAAGRAVDDRRLLPQRHQEARLQELSIPLRHPPQIEEEGRACGARHPHPGSSRSKERAQRAGTR